MMRLNEVHSTLSKSKIPFHLSKEQKEGIQVI